MEDIGHLWFEPDERIIGLEALFEGFSFILKTFVEKGKKCKNYNADFYFEETEIIYGTIFLSLQNYINKTSVDFLEVKLLECNSPSQLYNIGSKLVASNTTQIRLIITLANYFKHRDEKNKLFPPTEKCLKDVGLLQFSKKGDERYEDTLMIEGLLLLTNSISDINHLLQIVKEWRSNLLEMCYDLQRQFLLNKNAL